MLEQIRSLPHQAGIYQYLDYKGRILYIGKAKNLSKRVKSYFNLTPQLTPKSTLSLRIQKMLSECVSLNYIIVNNEHDALILENSLIKQLRPKYNILLRDDKTYPYLYIDLESPYPRFELTRKVISGKSIHYFGPFSVGARDILDSIYELLPLVQKKSCLQGKKACLFYQLKQCLGPCEFNVSKTHYDTFVQQGKEWIENKTALIDKLKEKMAFYAETLRYEEAKILRDRIEKIEKSQVHSNIDLASKEAYDIFAIASDSERSCVVRIFIRNGKVISGNHDFFPLSLDFSRDEGYERAVMNFYNHDIPPVMGTILVAHSFESQEWVQDHLRTLFKKSMRIENPKKGIKKQLTDLAYQNAESLLKTEKPTSNAPLAEIQQLFNLNRFPENIEIFDNSHLSGKATVGAMVTYQLNHFEKQGYRLYHLHQQDEYHQMREMLLRRIENFSVNPPPDLWVLDGGETLRTLANQLLESGGIELDVVAISKEKIDAKAYRAKGAARDIIYSDEGIFRLEPSDKRLQFIQLLRDEAHRKAITFHQNTKLKEDKHSKILAIKGVSTARLKRLIEYFGTFDAIYKADQELLETLVGEKTAQAIKTYVQEQDSLAK